MKLEFSQQIFEKYSDKTFMTVRLVEAELFYANEQKDGQTDTTMSLVAFAIVRTRLRART